MSVPETPGDLTEQLVSAVRASPKYRRVSADLVRRIGERELARRHDLKEAIKATRNKLHQVGAAYLDSAMPYQRWLDELEAAARSANREDLLSACARIMSHHASTRERLPLLHDFYHAIFADLPPIHTILDVACGLNPLAIPWMPLVPQASYYACDIYEEMVDFVGRCLPLLGSAGAAEVCDVAYAPPARRVDLALVLKTIPCLEQIDKSAGKQLLDMLNADHLVVSFPAHSLGGREKGMIANYEQRLREIAAGESWAIRRLEFETELVFVVTK